MDNSYTPPIDFYRAETPRGFPWLNVFLFLATCLSTLAVGIVQTAQFNSGTRIPDESIGSVLSSPSAVLAGVPFALAVMGILFAHEMGHYLMCRYYGIDASLPYFIPIPGPFTLVGTMGAFIRIRGPFQHRSAWLQMGIAGPIAGFMVAVPVLIVGLGLSRFVPISLAETEGMYQMGEPLIFKLMAFVLGMTPPEGMTLLLHPIATAAWFGFLATGLNLIPAGQLDGGHVLYALFRERGHRLASFGLMAVLAPLGFVWFGWWIWLIFLTVIGFVFGFSHPPSLNDSIPLRRGDIWLGWIALALFILCFMPAPIELS